MLEAMPETSSHSPRRPGLARSGHSLIIPLSIGVVVALPLVSLAAAVDTLRSPDEVGLGGALVVGAVILLAGIILGGWRAFAIVIKKAPDIDDALTVWCLGTVIAWITVVTVALATQG
jgi:hypothetical protein